MFSKQSIRNFSEPGLLQGVMFLVSMTFIAASFSSAAAGINTNIPWPDTNPTAQQIGPVPEPVAVPLKEAVRALQPEVPQAAVPDVVQGSPWVAQGPAPIQFGQVESLNPNNEVSGAIHVVLPDPGNVNTLYAAGVNGGIWKTTNAASPSPFWAPLIDSMPSLSIGAMEFDFNDPTYKTMVAGVGRFSSFARDGSDRVGIYITTDGGASWTHSDGSGLLNSKNISGVAVRGNTIVLSVDYAVGFMCSDIGIYRSTDGGVSFSPLNALGNGMPKGTVFDLEGHPKSPATLYSAVVWAGVCDSALNGIYKSIDTGANWTKVSSAAMDALLVSGNTSNVEIAIHDNGLGTHVVYVSILNFGQLINGGVFRSVNGGVWTQMDILQSFTPLPVGTNPRYKPTAGTPGGQGSIHFSIEADPVNSSVVYVGGDRQPNLVEEGLSPPTGPWFPNSIGANDYSGRLFRGVAFFPPGTQWENMTHVPTPWFPGGGTLSSSAPHADSREMAFDAGGDIIEGDDGGINRRTLPALNTGDWHSINGNLQVTEIHDIAYDSLSKVMISGTQDTGTIYQSAEGSSTWLSFSTGDGGQVVADNTTLAPLGQSIRYSSYQNLGLFAQTVWDASGNLLSTSYPPLTGFSGNPQFYTPVELNRLDPNRILFGGNDRLNESFDQGNTVIQLTPDFRAYGIDYGGMSAGSSIPEALWVAGDESGTPAVRVRTVPGTALSATAYAGATPIDIIMDPGDWNTAYVIDSNRVVWQTTDTGTTFTDVTGTLGSVGALRSLEYFEGKSDDFLLVGSDSGVFMAPLSGLTGGSFQTWNELGDNLPNAPAYEVVYNSTDDVLVVGTLGRGAWKIPRFGYQLEGFPWSMFLPAITGKKTP